MSRLPRLAIAVPLLLPLVLFALPARTPARQDLSGVLERAQQRTPAKSPELPGAPVPANASAPFLVSVPTDGEDAERLPLESVALEARVAGPVAQVRITQAFRNRGQAPIETEYVFPASTRAAIHGLRLRIGERTLQARIERRAEARREYEAAREEGRRAALLEEQRSNVFTMRVANVMPGDRIEAEIEYSEIVSPVDGVHELVLPLVVGPRFAGGPGGGGDGSWMKNPHLAPGERPPYTVSFRARLDAPVALREVSSPSHTVRATFDGPRSATVALDDKAARDAGNRDLILRWRLADDGIEAGLVTTALPEGGGHFLLQVQPPSVECPFPVLPREVIYVVDVSGSMRGFPLEVSRSILKASLDGLLPDDLFNVVLFSDSQCVVSPEGSLRATRENRQRAMRAFETCSDGGGTQFVEALSRAYRIPRPRGELARSVVIITDGYVPAEAEAFRLVQGQSRQATTWAVGIGTSVNRALVEAVARAGDGESFIATSESEARQMGARLRGELEHPLLADITVRHQGFGAKDVLPQRFPTLHAGRSLVVLGRYDGKAAGRIVVSGRTASGPWEKVVEVAGTEAPGAPLRVLWARRWVERLVDEHAISPDERTAAAIADVGVEHGLLTPWTSFVATDATVANPRGKPVPVRQVLPTPEGVPDTAYGSNALAMLRLAPHAAPQHFAVAPSAPPPPPPPRSPTPSARSAEVEVFDLEGLDGWPLRDIADEIVGRLTGSQWVKGDSRIVLHVDVTGEVHHVTVVEGDPRNVRRLYPILVGMRLKSLEGARLGQAGFVTLRVRFR